MPPANAGQFSDAREALSEFADLVVSILGTPGANKETSLYPAYQSLLERFAKAYRSSKTAVTQTASVGSLTPDFLVIEGFNRVGWVEVKAANKDLDGLAGHDKRQLDMYKKHLPWWIETNGWDWRLYEGGGLRGQVTFDRSVVSLKGAAAKCTTKQISAWDSLMRAFFTRPLLSYKSPQKAIEGLAVAARALKVAVDDEMRHPAPALTNVFDEFRNLVYAAGVTFTPSKFADAYAQTVAFGVLLARTTATKDLDPATAHAAVDANVNPFLSRCLLILLDPTVRAPLTWAVQELFATVNCVPPDLFRAQPGKADPLLYAYEQFFAAYDPAERQARGVYYTPPSVVAYQVSGVQTLLTKDFGLTGLGDARAHFLDPATGTGTYLLGLLDAVHAEAVVAGDAPDASIRALVDKQLFAFELMVGPYTVAHQRLGAYLSGAGVPPVKRLPVFLTDTLSEPLGGPLAASKYGIFGKELSDERLQSDGIKRDQPILVVLGNPPWERMQKAKLGDAWLKGLLKDAEERTPKQYRSNLKAFYDMFAAFWRWSLWLVNERHHVVEETGHQAIITFITNRNWIVGTAFAGLRDLVREAASDVYVLDLGADRRGSPYPSGPDEPVFDISVGQAICFVLISDDNAGADANVHYKRLAGTRSEKEKYLRTGFRRKDFVAVPGSAHDPFLPSTWGVLQTSPDIEQVFRQHETGLQTSRDGFIVWTDDAGLIQRLNDWNVLAEPERTGMFHNTRERTAPPFTSATGAPLTFLASDVVRYAYRPLDYRFLYNVRAFVDWPRPTLQKAFQHPNLALCTIERGLGAGPAAIPVDALPDLHVFRGHGGARGIYPMLGAADTLFDSGASTFTERVQEWLATLGASTRQQDAFWYFAAVLGAPSYTNRFFEGLESSRARLPLTLDVSSFDLGARLGKAWTALWTLKGTNLATVRWDKPPSPPKPTLGKATWANASISFEGGRILKGCPQAAWDFSVSGLQVLARYLEHRQHLDNLSKHNLDEVRLVVSSVSRIVDMGDDLDRLLDQVLVGPLA